MSSTYLSPSRTHCLLASKCLACQLLTPSIDIHLHQTIPLTTKPKISTVSLSISNGLSKKCSLPITLSSWSMGHLLKKTEAKRRRRRRQDPYLPLRELKLGAQMKRTKCFISVSPFPPSSLNILPSIRSGFDRVHTSCEPLFGSATQVTKVRCTLST